MRTRGPSSRPAHFLRRALLSILLGTGLSLGATAAAGLQPSVPRSVPDAAFVPVALDAAGADLAGGPRSHGPARSHAGTPIADPWLVLADPVARPRPSLPIARPVVETKPVAVTKAVATSHSISGRASWYCEAGVSTCSSSQPDTSGFDAYAAAGPRLRAAIGAGWRGKVVLVDGIRVKLIDWCQCYQGQANEKLLDLYHDVYLRTGSAVTVRW